MSHSDKQKTPQFYELIFSGPHAAIFALAEHLGFEDDLAALSLSVFDSIESDPARSELRGLYDNRESAETDMARIATPDDVQAKVVETEDKDWVSETQAGLPPVIAGPYVIYGRHDKDNISDARHPILIDAGMAFGTGHHGTTKGCLLMLADLVETGFTPKSILDLGTGAGILAIAAAKTYARNVLATDIDQDAVDVAQFNAKNNGVSAQVTALRADGFGHDALRNAQFELIFANILAGPLMGMAPGISAALSPGGKVILSGILDELADDVSAAFITEGLRIKAQPSLEGWTSLLGSKPA